jgi:phosphatidylserine/phosphatidylglycerophosphate/cardiolipin synthase-like enzyme
MNHPQGLGGQWDQASEAALAQLNADRAVAIDPLLRLREGMRQARNLAQQVQTLFAFLEDIGFADRLDRLAREMDEAGDNRSAQILNQLWEILVEALEQLYDVLGETTWDDENFTRLLRLLLSQYDVGTIPPVLDSVSVGEYVYLDMIERAEKSLYVFTPYLILDDLTRGALCRAALRGVDVRIVTPSIPDKKTVYRLTRANYGILMKAGVKIYEYTPGFIHAKSMVCDGEYAVVGTINLDYRSLYLHFENAVYFSHCPAVGGLERDCEETFAVSKLCTKENVKRGVIGRLFDSVLRVFETLL